MAFETIIRNEENQFIITLRDSASGTFAEVYAFGALLNKFCAFNNKKLLHVIDGFSNPGEAIEKITPSFKSAKLSPYVCRVKDAKYKFGKQNYQLTKYLSGNHAIHGLIFNEIFSIKAHNSDNNAASVRLEYAYDNNGDGYPFHYKCVVEYKLAVENALTVETTVTNTDNQLIPIADGWHPYFMLGDSIDDYQVEFQSKEMLEFDENLLPTGKLLPYQEFSSLKNLGTTVLDNCFTLNFAECQPMCVIRNPAIKAQVEFYPSESYPYLQIYTPGERKSIAVENLSAAPDAFNNGIGLKVLEPDESAVFSAKFIIRFL